MSFLLKVHEIVGILTKWMWGIPILAVLGIGGVALTVIIGGIQFKRFGFIFKNTIGTIFDKNSEKDKSDDGITPLQGMVAALSATVGTGNMVGVGVAIATGGPGALFWMWVVGFIAMAIKYAEVTMACKYRESDGEGGFKGGPYMYIKNGLKNIPLANFFGIMMLICLTIINAVHASSISSNLNNIGVPKVYSMIFMILFLVAIIWGGMKSLVKITDVLVPVMTFIYGLLVMIVIFSNIGNIGTVFSLIFKGAFTGMAPVGGFAGAALSSTIRNGFARGVFSNDAGLGLSASVQSQVKDIGHPAKQGMWAIVETFIDTIVICTLTGLVILFTGVWQDGGDGSTFTINAMGSVLGRVGTLGGVMCLVMFGLSSLITNAQGVRIQAISMFNSPLAGRLFQVGIVALIIAGSMGNIETAFLYMDFTNGIILFVNVLSLLMLHKSLRATTKEWFDNNGNIELINNELDVNSIRY